MYIDIYRFTNIENIEYILFESSRKSYQQNKDDTVLRHITCWRTIHRIILNSLILCSEVHSLPFDCLCLKVCFYVLCLVFESTNNY